MDGPETSQTFTIKITIIHIKKSNLYIFNFCLKFSAFKICWVEILVQKSFGSKKNRVQQNFGSKTKFWVQRNFGSKHIEKEFWMQKSVLSKSGRGVECVQQKMTNDDDEVGSRREKGITVL